MKKFNKSAEKRALWAVGQRYGVDAGSSDDKRQRAPVEQSTESGSGGGLRKVLPAQKKGRWIKRIFIFIILAAAVIGGVFGYKIIAAGDKISVADRSIIGQLKDLLLNQENYLAGENDGRINVLLLAVGGPGHKGEDLADTIMIASIDPLTNKSALLSIPRDLYVQVPNQEFYSKINAVHAYGESQKRDYGPKLLSELVEEITGQPIHYYVRVDFTAFKGIIDAVGGVNISIKNSFFDYWHKISFPAGTEKMNGERALAYVRARYIEGPEGGDFKRAARQQQVLVAVREKVFSLQTALDFNRINSILNSLSENIRTDMQLWEMKRFYELARQLDTNNMHSEVLISGPKGVLVGGTEVLGGVPASILKPRTNDYSEIQNIAHNMLRFSQKPIGVEGGVATPEEQNEVEVAQEEPAEEEVVEEITKPALEIRNGTNINGLAKKYSDKFKSEGFQITTIGNANNNDIAKTKIYALAEEHQSGAKLVLEQLDIEAEIKVGLPGEEPASSAEVLLVLGKDIENVNN